MASLLARYAKVIPIKKHQGYFLRVDAEAAACLRKVSEDFVWYDGAPCPQPDSFQFCKFVTIRYAFPGDGAEKAVLVRSLLATRAIGREEDWCGNVASTSLVGGGLWTQGFMEAAIDEVWDRIYDALGDKVCRADLVCVIGDEDAKRITDAGHKLPACVVIEKTRHDGEPIIPEGTAYFLTRTSDTYGKEGESELSTLQLLVAEDLIVEERNGPDGKRRRIIDDHAMVLVAPASGFCLRDITRVTRDIEVPVRRT